MMVFAAALLAVMCLPCAVALAARSDGDAARRRTWRHRRRAEVRALRRLDRDLPTAVTRVEHAAPSIEQIAADLRRLDRQRHTGPTTGSEVWLAAVRKAYDDRLQIACRYLTVTQHMDTLNGIDRDIERVRVEGELQAAGLALRSIARPPH
jgi:hypothetical protein